MAPPELLVIDPVKTPGPTTSMPTRSLPVANAPPTTPVLPSTAGVYDIPRSIAPAVVTEPVSPPCTTTPVELLTSVLEIAPPDWMATVLLELSTTPAPPVAGFTVQPASMLMLPADEVVVPAAGQAANA